MRIRKIAVVDGDQRSLGELEEILSRSGYDPVLVADPCKAVEMFVQDRPDVVLMELRMPQKNGFELTDTINRVFETRKIPIIAMSEVFADECSWLLDLCGIKGRIKKPFQPLDVIWAIENEIEESHYRQRAVSAAGNY